MLSHELLASSAIAFAYGLPVHRTEGVYLAFLPLSHIFARYARSSPGLVSSRW